MTRTPIARAAVTSAGNGVQLRRAAGDVERRDPAALKEGQHGVRDVADISSVRCGLAPTWQCTQDWLQR
jgi:hypothetical protein